MISIPEILQTEAEAAAVIHLTAPRGEMRKVFGPAVGELMAALAEQGVKPSSPVFAHHLKMSLDTFDFRIGRESCGACKGNWTRETGRASCNKGCPHRLQRSLRGPPVSLE